MLLKSIIWSIILKLIKTDDKIKQNRGIITNFANIITIL